MYFLLFVAIPTVRGNFGNAPAKPWEGATTLEWEVPSPAPFHTWETPPDEKLVNELAAKQALH